MLQKVKATWTTANSYAKNKKVAYPERIRCNQMENDMAV